MQITENPDPFAKRMRISRYTPRVIAPLGVFQQKSPMKYLCVFVPGSRT